MSGALQLIRLKTRILQGIGSRLAQNQGLPLDLLEAAVDEFHLPPGGYGEGL